MQPSQLFDVLDPATLAGLRDSVQRLGVLVPIAKDQDGNVLDGHHRVQVADELGVKYRIDVIQCADEQQRDEIRRTLNVDRRQLSGDDLKRHIVTLALLREPSGVGALSQTEIAERAGVDQAYVSRTLASPELMTGHKLPTQRRGKDGKVRKASRPAVVTAKNAREADRAQAALTAIPDATGTMDVRQAERKAKKQSGQLAAPATAVVPSAADLRTGDFRDVLDDLADIDAIVTDPPYPGEYLPLLSDLSRLAGRVLRPGGICAVMIGQSYLPEVYARLSEHLDYWWTIAYLTPGGQSAQVWQRKVNTFWKPVLIFGRGRYEGDWYGDVAKSPVNDNDKDHHHWGQSEAGMADILERITKPGQIVLDPFLGAGTTGVAATLTGRRFIGCDIDAEHVTTAQARMAEAANDH
jgi:ParB-like chromosome segregation protein Spo0J